MTRRRLWLLPLGLAIPALAFAHANTRSSSEVTVGEGSVEIALRTADQDLAFALEGLDADADGRISRSELDGGRRSLESYFLARCGILLEGRSCPGRLDGADLREGEVLLRLRFDLPRAGGRLSFRVRPYEDNDPLHEHVATVRLPGKPPYSLFFQGGASFDVDVAAPPPASSSRGCVRLGLLHILAGWDHLLFLAALLLAARSLKGMAGVVTGFTLGHSLTLVAAGLGFLALPGSLVEPAIAASIAFVGFENLRPEPGRRRWLVATAFGLVHGMGFAAGLREILPEGRLIWSLLCFNVGVEVGQLAVVGVCWPLSRRAGRLSRPLSLVIALAGVGLFLARILPGRVPA